MIVALAAVAAFAWTHPATDPYTGDFSSAINRYVDIPADARSRLKEKVASRRYDAMVRITKDGVSDGYTGLRDMHFGAGRVIPGPVSTASWPADRVERALVFCEQQYCVAIPTVCRNVSRVTPPEPRQRMLLVQGPGPEMTWEELADPTLPLPPLALALTAPEPAPAAPPRSFASFAPQGFAPSGFAWAVPGTPVPVPAAPVTPIPEPSTWALVALGLVGVMLRAKKGGRK